MAMRERRAAHRYKLALPLVVSRGPSLGEEGVFHGKTRDISTDGLYFTTNQPLELGEVLNFSLTFPGLADGDALVMGSAKVLRVVQKLNTVSEPVGVAAVIQKFYIVSPKTTVG